MIHFEGFCLHGCWMGEIIVLTTGWHKKMFTTKTQILTPVLLQSTQHFCTVQLNSSFTHSQNLSMYNKNFWLERSSRVDNYFHKRAKYWVRYQWQYSLKPSILIFLGKLWHQMVKKKPYRSTNAPGKQSSNPEMMG